MKQVYSQTKKNKTYRKRNQNKTYRKRNQNKTYRKRNQKKTYRKRNQKKRNDKPRIHNKYIEFDIIGNISRKITGGGDFSGAMCNKEPLTEIPTANRLIISSALNFKEMTKKANGSYNVVMDVNCKDKVPGVNIVLRVLSYPIVYKNGKFIYFPYYPYGKDELIKQKEEQEQAAKILHEEEKEQQAGKILNEEEKEEQAGKILNEEDVDEILQNRLNGSILTEYKTQTLLALQNLAPNVFYICLLSVSNFLSQFGNLGTFFDSKQCGQLNTFSADDTFLLCAVIEKVTVIQDIIAKIILNETTIEEHLHEISQLVYNLLHIDILYLDFTPRNVGLKNEKLVLFDVDPLYTCNIVYSKLYHSINNFHDFCVSMMIYMYTFNIIYLNILSPELIVRIILTFIIPIMKKKYIYQTRHEITFLQLLGMIIAVEDQKGLLFPILVAPVFLEYVIKISKRLYTQMGRPQMRRPQMGRPQMGDPFEKFVSFQSIISIPILKRCLAQEKLLEYAILYKNNLVAISTNTNQLLSDDNTLELVELCFEEDTYTRDDTEMLQLF